MTGWKDSDGRGVIFWIVVLAAIWGGAAAILFLFGVIG